MTEKCPVLLWCPEVGVDTKVPLDTEAMVEQTVQGAMAERHHPDPYGQRHIAPQKKIYWGTICISCLEQALGR
ncbi:hypothetical protein Q8A67_018758 [Cirrhinus molitorella]|uniref:Uncharacterized protein n=1 Tax=Cirrhinus molitorella TaxID=172907 RepID=A0AA88TR21_9TELE|nr:hypothetical protein Q8A67_018758 [Cirrhinus molitorella]